MSRYTYVAKLRRIIDGDTIIANVDVGFYITLNNLKFRLMNYNAPEVRGVEKPLGKIAKRQLQELIPVNSELLIKVYKADAFGRYLCDIILPDGQTLSEFLVKLGYGVHWDGKGKRPSFDPTASYPDSSLNEKINPPVKVESHLLSEEADPSQSS